MTSQSYLSTSSRHPLKRVRPDNENQRSILSSNERNKKKIRRQSSQDSAFGDIEKSSDERAFDLFQNEYFHQIRPYFKHQSTARQLIEHIWFNLNESSKVTFLKKILQNSSHSHLSTIHLNNNETLSNDENSRSSSLNQSNENLSLISTTNKYNRMFFIDLLIYFKHWVKPRFIDHNSSLKFGTPSLRRSSRIRRAPIKCVCSACVTTRNSSSPMINDSQQKIFQELIDHYLKLDDQYVDRSKSSAIINDNQIEMTLSEIVESIDNVVSSTPIVSIDNHDQCFSSSIDYLIDSSAISNEKSTLITSDSLLSDQSLRRTYVILTELDEPFFGPYPVEFTITI